jgi:hypothetical protein
MKRTWQRELEAQMYRDSQQPCTCENNGDLCVSCEAVDYLQSLTRAAKAYVNSTGRGLTKVLATIALDQQMPDMVICVWLNVANDTRDNRVYSTSVADLYRNECPFQSALPCWSR